MPRNFLLSNDWLAHHNTFDMAYIMNSGKEKADQPMYSPRIQKYRNIMETYKKYLTRCTDHRFSSSSTIRSQTGVENSLRQTFYENAIQNIIYKQTLGKDESEATDEEKDAANEQAKAYVEQNKDNIDADPDGYVRTKFGDAAADQLKEQG